MSTRRRRKNHPDLDPRAPAPTATGRFGVDTDEATRGAAAGDPFFTAAPDPAAKDFLLRLGELLHTYGTPANRLESELDRVARRLGLQGHFLSSPTSLLVAIGPLASQRTHLLRVDQGEVDLGKLAELAEIIEDVEGARASPAQGLERLEAVASASPRYGRLAFIAAFGGAAACASRFFGGGMHELLHSLAIGLILGTIASLVSAHRRFTGLFEPFACMLAILLAHALASFLAPASVEIVTLASVVVLIPGLTFTLAMSELATNHLVSGTARLAKAAILFLTMGFGVALGSKSGELAFPGGEMPIVPEPLAPWTEWVALAFAPLGFGVLFQARPRDLGLIVLSGALSYTTARFARIELGPELGAFLGATTVGLFSNAYSLAFRRPASIPLLPGILLLVPGSVGFRSVHLFLAADAAAGIEAAFRMALVAAALVAGLLAANALLAPRRVL